MTRNGHNDNAVPPWAVFLRAELRKSFEMCDRAYAKLTAGNAAEVLPFIAGKRPRLALAWFHISHANEHYGTIVTYLRLKGIVPPSSEPR
jgi:hypothetical protein